MRNSIAMCLALTVAYYLNLDEPYWAMTSAAVVSFPTVGGVISKSLGRVAGSLLGATAAMIIAGHTLNDPWLFLFAMAAWIGFCTWACAQFSNNVAYAFQLAGYTAAIIALSGGQYYGTPPNCGISPRRAFVRCCWGFAVAA